MPVADRVLNGGEFALYVESTATPGTFVEVSDINRFSKRSNRNVASFPVFRRGTAYSIPGTREVTYTASGFANPGDEGQSILRAAEVANSNVLIKVVPISGDDADAGATGVDGFTHLVRVGTTSHDASPDGLQETSFELSAVADATTVGTNGFIL